MSPAAFYIGEVRHRRFGEITHRLRYRLAWLLVDLDRLEEANSLSTLLGVGRSGAMSMHPRDHGEGNTDDLAGWVRALLRAQGVARPAARIELFTLPRMFGYVFNPLSAYFVYGAAGDLHHILYEVGNTFGERHFYLCPAGPGEHEVEKEFYVSPFLDVSGVYRFRVRPPDAAISLTIRHHDAEGTPVLGASLRAQRAPVTGLTCLKILAGLPFMTLGVMAGIHWEAFKLWRKGAVYRLHGRGRQPARITTGTGPVTAVRSRRMERDAA